MNHIFRNYRNFKKLGWVAAGKLDIFTGSVMTIDILIDQWLKSNSIYSVSVNEQNLAKENLSNQEKNKVQQGGELKC